MTSTSKQRDALAVKRRQRDRLRGLLQTCNGDPIELIGEIDCLEVEIKRLLIGNHKLLVSLRNRTM